GFEWVDGVIANRRGKNQDSARQESRDVAEDLRSNDADHDRHERKDEATRQRRIKVLRTPQNAQRDNDQQHPRGTRAVWPPWVLALDRETVSREHVVGDADVLPRIFKIRYWILDHSDSEPCQSGLDAEGNHQKK